MIMAWIQSLLKMLAFLHHPMYQVQVLKSYGNSKLLTFKELFYVILIILFQCDFIGPPAMPANGAPRLPGPGFVQRPPPPALGPLPMPLRPGKIFNSLM